MKQEEKRERTNCLLGVPGACRKGFRSREGGRASDSAVALF